MCSSSRWPTFDKAIAFGPVPAQKVDIPYEGTTLPAYFLRAHGHEDDMRPVDPRRRRLGLHGRRELPRDGRRGAARGYHVLLHDGPGQGRLLIDDGLPLRHDWE